MQPTFVGGLLFAALEIVPLTADGPFTLLRAVGIAALLAIADGLVMVGRPRTRRRALPGAAGVPAVRLELGGEALPPSYQVALVLADGSRHLVLEGPEPARVLGDAAHLARTIGVPLGAGWGLAEQSLGELAAGGAGKTRLTDFKLEHRPIAGQRAAAITTLWASSFVLIASCVMADGPERAGLVPSVLSLSLPWLSAFFLLVIGI